MALPKTLLLKVQSLRRSHSRACSGWNQQDSVAWKEKRNFELCTFSVYMTSWILEWVVLYVSTRHCYMKNASVFTLWIFMLWHTVQLLWCFSWWNMFLSNSCQSGLSQVNIILLKYIFLYIIIHCFIALIAVKRNSAFITWVCLREVTRDGTSDVENYWEGRLQGQYAAELQNIQRHPFKASRRLDS